MKLLLLIAFIHFLAGAIGISIINKKLAPERKKKNLIKYFVYLAIFVTLLSSLLLSEIVFRVLCIIILAAGFLELLDVSKLSEKRESGTMIISVSVAVYSVLSLMFVFFVFLPVNLIAYTYLLVIIFDGASQIAGQIKGKRKLVPSISPDKTIEGLIGGFLSAVVTSVLLRKLGDFTVVQSLLFGFLICLTAFLGDLASSAYKRFFSVKDFSKLLPGNGGMVDRFDSLIVTGSIIGGLSLLPSFSINRLDKEIVTYIGFSIGYVLILGSAEIMYYRTGFRSEYTRIISHLLTGILSLFLITSFSSPWLVPALCIQSSLFLYAIKKMELFDSHNTVNRKTAGSILFFPGILIAYMFSLFYDSVALYILPVTILSISDPFAALAGLDRKTGFWSSSKKGILLKKTYAGSITFFISALIILFAGIPIFFEIQFYQLLIYSIVIAIVTTTAELVSSHGIDNITIPLVAAVTLALMFA